MTSSTALVCIVLAVALDLQDLRNSDSATHRSSAELVSVLRAEAARVEKGPTSKLFEALAPDEDIAEPKRLSLEQGKLIRRVDEMVRATLRFYLLRGLDKAPLPPVPELAGRVDEHGERVKKALVAHAEAIVLEAVLTPSQAKIWRAKATVPRISPQAGRYSLTPETISSGPQPRTYMDFRRDLTNEAKWQMQNSDEEALRMGTDVTASELFTVVLKGDVKDAISNRSPEQLDILRRLDRLTRDVHGTWILRAVDKKPPPADLKDEPPTRAMMERFSDNGERLRASIVAHAEAIALTGVLSSSQAEQSKRRVWASRGVRALSDPELASLLRLTRWQRDEFASRLQARAFVVSDSYDRLADQSSAQLGAHTAGLLTTDDLANLSKRSKQSVDQFIAEHDNSIWSLLSKPQLKALEVILGKPVPTRPDAKTRKRNRPS